jgi:hypothetical protein
MAAHSAPPPPDVVAALVLKWLDAEAVRPTTPTLTLHGKEGTALFFLLLTLIESGPEVLRPAAERMTDVIIARGIEENRG